MPQRNTAPELSKPEKNFPVQTAVRAAEPVQELSEPDFTAALSEENMKNPPFIIDYTVQLNDISPDAKMRKLDCIQLSSGCSRKTCRSVGVGIETAAGKRFELDSFPDQTPNG